MKISGDDSLVALYGDALDFAVNMQEDLNSFHFLLSFFTTPSEVSVLFEDVNLTTIMVTSAYKELRKQAHVHNRALNEPGGTVKRLEEKVVTFLQHGEERPCALHFLCAITSVRNSLAYRILAQMKFLSEVRLHAFSMLERPASRVKARMGELFNEATKILPEQEEKTITKVAEKEFEKSFESDISDSNTNIESKPVISFPVDGIELPEIFNQLGRNLTSLAMNEELESFFGREQEFEQVLDILCRKRNNNPCIIGPAGSGKTTLVEGIACRQKDGTLSQRIIWELNLPALISGTEYRGSLEKRVTELLKEVERMKDTIIVFIDELHLINRESSEVLANMLKPALARGNFPLIGATTTDEFKKYLAVDPAMERRFTIVNLPEPEGKELYRIVKHATESLTSFHAVHMNDEMLVKTAIRLSNRYISGKSQPDRVLSLLDSLGAVLSRTGKQNATKKDLMNLVSTQTGIPVENLLVDGSKILRMLPERMNRELKGQHPAKKKIAQLLARRFNRKETEKPIASFIFAGPTGVGKTEMAKKLAEFFFGSEKKMVVFDMSEFQEQHAVSRLIGAPPGYSGFDEGGQLTEAFRREPYQLLLLDEIEKAHPKVLTVLLQILEEGRISDTRGFTVNLSESIIVMTTNLGAEEYVSARVGFGSDENSGDIRETLIVKKIESFLSPELMNRVDEIALFTPFKESELIEIAESMICGMLSTVSESYGIEISVDDARDIADYLVKEMTGKERALGARAVKRHVEKKIEGLVLDHMYANETAGGVEIFFDKNNQGVMIRTTA